MIGKFSVTKWLSWNTITMLISKSESKINQNEMQVHCFHMTLQTIVQLIPQRNERMLQFILLFPCLPVYNTGYTKSWKFIIYNTLTHILTHFEIVCWKCRTCKETREDHEDGYRDSPAHITISYLYVLYLCGCKKYRSLSCLFIQQISALKKVFIFKQILSCMYNQLIHIQCVINFIF